MHSSITLERVAELIEQSMAGMENAGICLACGEDTTAVNRMPATSRCIIFQSAARLRQIIGKRHGTKAVVPMPWPKLKNQKKEFKAINHPA